MGQVRELLESLTELVKIPALAEPSAADRARWDKRTAELLGKLEKHPAVAEDGKAFVILWAEGRAIVAYRNKRDAIAFVKDKQHRDDIVWIHYDKPFTRSGTRIKVRNKY